MLQHAQHSMIAPLGGPAACRYAFTSFQRPYSQAWLTVTAKAGNVADAGTYTVRGTVRKQNEDRLDLKVSTAGALCV
jgi:hypothetical protein